jgi:hypothetical protein
LMFSAIIDDFAKSLFLFSEKLTESLIRDNLITTEVFWGDFSSAHTFYGKIG